MPLAIARPWGCDKCGYANENTHQECRYCFHRKGRGRYILYSRTRSHHGFMELDNEKFGVDYYLWENQKRGGGGEIRERSIVFWLPGIREGEDARPDQGWTIDYGNIGSFSYDTDFKASAPVNMTDETRNVNIDDSANPPPSTNCITPPDSNGWDGKLRVERRAEVVNAEILSDPEYSDEDAPPVEQINADDDLLDDYEPDTDEIDLVHRRISSIPALRLERFQEIEKLCLRQNAISHINFPENFGSRLQELDLYDNLISHIKGLEAFRELTSLDLSFNNIKHVKNVNHLKKLTDIYFVQNKITKIEGLEGLDKLRNLELAANKIREIENLESLTSLEELWLGKNKITELKDLSHLPALKILSIQSNRLPSISNLTSLPSLEELYISHNILTSISPTSLASNPNLRVLDISNNKIAHLENLSHLANLEELWASSNLIDSFEEVERELAEIGSLETVYFEANPLQLRGPAVYRNKVRLALPQVKQIDATFVRVS